MYLIPLRSPSYGHGCLPQTASGHVPFGFRSVYVDVYSRLNFSARVPTSKIPGPNLPTPLQADGKGDAAIRASLPVIFVASVHNHTWRDISPCSCPALKPRACSTSHTYSNACVLATAQRQNQSLQQVVRPASDRPHVRRICTKEYVQVSDAQGRVYGNACLFEVARCKEKDRSLLLRRITT